MDLSSMLHMGEMGGDAGQDFGSEEKGKGKGMGKMMQMMFAMMKGKGGGKGKASLRVAKGDKVYFGTVRKYNAEKSHGFIWCPEIFEETQSEVYAHKSILEEAQAGVGDDILFFLHHNAKGQGQASSPCLRASIGREGAFALKGTFKKREDQAFGFIECPATMDFFGRDVYVHKDLVHDLQQGMHVAFNIRLNRDGHPNASIICQCQEFYEPEETPLHSGEIEVAKGKGKGKDGMMDMMSMMMGGGMGMDPMSSMMMMAMMGGMGGMDGMGGGMGKGKGKGGGGGKKGGGLSGEKRPAETGEYMTGTVKSFNEANNYGFIACDEAKAKYGADVFVIGQELGDFSVGTQVMFAVGLNAAGKPQALDVKSMTGEPAPKRARSGGWGGDAGFAAAEAVLQGW